MKINNFYFSPLTFNLVVNVKRPSVTDKTFFRPDVNTVRNLDTGQKKKQFYHFEDGKYDSTKDLSALSHFPERVEVVEMVDVLKTNIEKQIKEDVFKSEINSAKKLDKDFKEKMIDSVSKQTADSLSVVSDS